MQLHMLYELSAGVNTHQAEASMHVDVRGRGRTRASRPSCQQAHKRGAAAPTGLLLLGRRGRRRHVALGRRPQHLRCRGGALRSVLGHRHLAQDVGGLGREQLLRRGAAVRVELDHAADVLLQVNVLRQRLVAACFLDLRVTARARWLCVPRAMACWQRFGRRAHVGDERAGPAVHVEERGHILAILHAKPPRALLRGCPRARGGRRRALICVAVRVLLWCERVQC